MIFLPSLNFKKYFIQRRNIGYIEAYRRCASIIATVDDDNIPQDDWGQEIFLNQSIECNSFSPENDTIKVWDPIATTKYQHLWHRGFPIDLLKTKNNLVKTRHTIRPSIQADFWNGDPDVDAVQRLIYNLDCNFSDESFPMCGKVFAPFNSQNTFLTREAVKDFYLFPYIGRMDDPLPDHTMIRQRVIR